MARQTVAAQRLASQPRVQEKPSGRRIGLLGGSFNPAHAGHVGISLRALKLLALDQVWWLISPQNPLKSADDMAPYDERLRSAKAVARHSKIRVSEAESKLGTRFTADTIPRLLARHPRDRFVWIMGADNLTQIVRWRQWRTIFRSIPIAVFDRPTYSLIALSGKAACCFRHARLKPGSARRLAIMKPPRWVFLDKVRDPISATSIRRAAQPSNRTNPKGEPT